MNNQLKLFYLKKLKYDYEKFSSLGPFVSGGQIVNEEPAH